MQGVTAQDILQYLQMAKKIVHFEMGHLRRK